MAKKAAATPTPTSTPTAKLIRRQRDAMQMTVAQLADRVGVSRNTITNYEAGKTEPTASDLVRLSSALGCTIAELLHGGAAPPPRFAFRAHMPLRRDPSIIVSARKYVRAYDELEEILDARLCGKLRKFTCDNDGPLTDREIEMAADTLRQTSDIHDAGPENIAGVLEGLGVRTLFFEYEGKGLEGLSTIQDDMVLVMLRNRKKVVERTIFSAAHELGHLVLHPQLFTSDTDDVEIDTKRFEREADKFAGNFLVPSDEIIRIWKEERLHKLSLFNALVLLKRVFRVSFHCLYHRVTDLNLTEPIEPGVFINEIKRHLAISGPAKMDDLEPDPLSPDVLYRTTRFNRLARSAFLRNLVHVSKIAEMFQITIEKAQMITSEWLRPKHELVEESPV